MENDHIALGNAVETIADTFLKLLGDEFRWELAFAKLPEEMIERLRAYGNEESFPADATLYTYGDRRTDMFVVLDGEVHIFIRSTEGAAKIYARYRKHSFTEEFNLLTSQGAVVEARTILPSTLLRISRTQFERVMHAEGDIANVIVAACICAALASSRRRQAG